MESHVGICWWKTTEGNDDLAPKFTYQQNRTDQISKPISTITNSYLTKSQDSGLLLLMMIKTQKLAYQ